MTRVCLLVGFLVVSAGAACNRPSESDCRKAIENIRVIVGTEADDAGDTYAAVRSCRGNATKASVDCLIAAKTVAHLEACEGGLFEEMYKQEDAAGADKGNKGDKPADKGDKPADKGDKPADK